MIDYIFTIGCFDKLHNGHIELLKNMKKRCNKLIVGLYNDNCVKRLKNISIVDSYDIRKNSLKKYIYDIFEIKYIFPLNSIQEYITKKFGNNLSIPIGSSKSNKKVIKNNYKGDLYFLNEYNNIFNYYYKDNNIIINRNDNNCGWSINLVGYKKNWCFYIPSNYNYISMLKKYMDSIGMVIKNVPPLIMHNYNILEKYEKMKIDWVVGWINPEEKKKFKKEHNIQRLRDNNELLYFLKSIYKYGNWINKIYIILAQNSKPPKWLKCNDKIVLIQETQLYKNIQPNSETKKLFYGLIPNISELFIAGDDDYLLGDFIYKSDFFTSNSIPIVNSVHCIGINKAHIPIAWNKISYNEAVIHNDFSYYLKMGHKRKNPWIEIKDYLLKNKMIRNGNKKSPDIWLNYRNCNNCIKYFNYIKKNNPKYICINDDWSKEINVYKKQYKILNDFYKSFLPETYDFIIDDLL